MLSAVLNPSQTAGRGVFSVRRSVLPALVLFLLVCGPGCQPAPAQSAGDSGSTAAASEAAGSSSDVTGGSTAGGSAEQSDAVPAAAGAVAASVPVATPASLSEGEKLFRENRPKEAAAALEKAVLTPGVDERAWLYLAASYEEEKRYSDAISALRKGLPQAIKYRHLFYFDMGNLFALQGKSSFAEEMYGKAIAENGDYAYAYLNRANARMALKNYEGAGGDYRLYLEKDPDSPQREAIEKMLSLMQNDIAAAQAAAAAAAAQAKADEEAKAALLAQVEASLKEAAEQTQSLSAGPGEAQSYDDEPELE